MGRCRCPKEKMGWDVWRGFFCLRLEDGLRRPTKPRRRKSSTKGEGGK